MFLTVGGAWVMHNGVAGESGYFGGFILGNIPNPLSPPPPCTQLLSLSTTRNDSGTYFSEIGRWDNTGPIVDFVVLDPERQGQGQLVACSGARRDGSLRVIRTGIGFVEQAR
eukprot:scaffold15383_cov61-Isochrysis_galbana.AAC.1